MNAFANIKFFAILLIMTYSINSCKEAQKGSVEIYETSAQGNALKKINADSKAENPTIIKINPATINKK